MKNKTENTQPLIGLIAAASVAFVSIGLADPATATLLSGVSNIGAGLAANFLTRIKIKNWFGNVHPDDLNHSIKKLFIESINKALNNISVLFSETHANDSAKKEAKQLIKELQKYLPNTILNNNQIRLEESEIKRFLYEEDSEEKICDFIKSQFGTFGITEPFKSFLEKNLFVQIQLCFGEGLKDSANENAWIDFQRMLIGEIRNDIKKITKSIKDDLSDLKFEKSGFSEEQIAEIRELIKVLNNKKIVEVKIGNGINQSLKSIENKANEIIRITTKTHLTVNELKTIIEKIKRQNRTNHIIIYTLSVCLLVAGVFVAHRLTNQPFTTTIQVYGWESEQHNPLNGKGAIIITLSDKTEKAEINRKGEAIFKSIPSEYKGKKVAIYITDTENEPYYLMDSIIKIRKNNITKVQILLHGLEKLEGTVFDDISSEGLPEVSVTLAGISTITDVKGYFCIDNIPLEQQKQEQKIIISKDGYKEKRETVSMTGEYNVVLERK